MNPLLYLEKTWGIKSSRSHSFLIDFYQRPVRSLLFVCTCLGVSRVLLVESILCHVDARGVPRDLVERHCFINGTMTRGTPTLYHSYYQWVPVYLLLLTLAISLPFLVWFRLFGSTLEELESLADDPKKGWNLVVASNGDGLYLKTFALELFYAAYGAGLVYLTNLFYNHYWTLYGWPWLAVPHIFPDNGSCFYSYFQSSGTTDAKFNCLLPLNSVYRKIFTVLYGVAGLLAALHAGTFLYRILLFCAKGRWIHQWWALQILLDASTSWQARATYRNLFQNERKKRHKKNVDLEHQ